MDKDIAILDHVSLIRTYCKYDVDLTIKVQKVYVEMRKRFKANKRMLFIEKIKI
jgi:hypothetical protein